MRVRAQDVPYMTKEWKGAIRAERRAARKYLKEQTSENWEAMRIASQKRGHPIPEKGNKDILERASH